MWMLLATLWEEMLPADVGQNLVDENQPDPVGNGQPRIDIIILRCLGGYDSYAAAGSAPSRSPPATAAVSFVVSSIMIGVITYNSVLVLWKNGGILRAKCTSRRSISGIFNVETFITGKLSGCMDVCDDDNDPHDHG